MPTASLVAVHAQKCQENANVLASPSSRHRAGKYDENVMDVNTFDVLLLVLVGLLVLLGVFERADAPADRGRGTGRGVYARGAVPLAGRGIDDACRGDDGAGG